MGSEVYLKILAHCCDTVKAAARVRRNLWVHYDRMAQLRDEKRRSVKMYPEGKLGAAILAEALKKIVGAIERARGGPETSDRTRRFQSGDMPGF